MYNLIGLDESSASRNKSWAVSNVDVWSWTYISAFALFRRYLVAEGAGNDE